MQEDKDHTTNDASFYNRELVSTGDGSHSIFLPAFNEFYHSSHGAVQESLHVFIRHGLEAKVNAGQKVLRILEMGFGTGLNALLAWQYAKGANLQVHYTTLEAFPVAAAMLEQLNYAQQLPEGAASLFAQLHEAKWETEAVLDPHFTLLKHETMLSAFRPEAHYDLVFYDAFAPRVQPELWTREVFDQLAAAMAPGALLVTYCAKGEVKRNMKAAGLLVEALPGPPGKREMTRARKS